jgi:hypothetical protein
VVEGLPMGFPYDGLHRSVGPVVGGLDVQVKGRFRGCVTDGGAVG